MRKHNILFRLAFAFIIMQFAISCSNDSTISNNSVPILHTLQLSDINQVCDNTQGCITSLKCTGQIISTSDVTVIEKGICYGSKNPPTIYDHKIADESANEKFIATITGLNSDLVYYFRAYVKTTNGTFYGNVVAYNTKITDIDGNKYKTINIGRQTWMAENLKVTRFRNGDVIPVVTDKGSWSNLASGAYSFYNFDKNNAEVFGMLYNYYAVTDSRNICPEGWHIPTESEWKELYAFLGADNTVGGKLKEQGTTNWLNPNVSASNDYQFTGLPGGYINAAGEFGGSGMKATWWTSTQADNMIAWSYDINFNEANLNIRGSDKRMGFSIRCIKD